MSKVGPGNRGMDETITRGTKWSEIRAKYNSDDRIKKNEMGGPRIKYAGQEKCQQDLVGEEN